MTKRDVFLGAHISGLTADKILNSMYNPGTLALNPQVMNFAIGCFSIVVFAPHSQSVLFTSAHPVQDYSTDAPACPGWSRLSFVSNTSPQASKLPLASTQKRHRPNLSKCFHSFQMKMLIWPRPYMEMHAYLKLHITCKLLSQSWALHWIASGQSS